MMMPQTQNTNTTTNTTTIIHQGAPAEDSGDDKQKYQGPPSTNDSTPCYVKNRVPLGIGLCCGICCLVVIIL